MHVVNAHFETLSDLVVADLFGQVGVYALWSLNPRGVEETERPAQPPGVGIGANRALGLPKTRERYRIAGPYHGASRSAGRWGRWKLSMEAPMGTAAVHARGLMAFRTPFLV